MNIRVGTDVVEIERMKRLIQKDSFLNKVFSREEIEYCQQKPKPEASFAARFAAKEAFFKALGTGLYAQGMGPQDVWITNDANGRPKLNFSEAAAQIMAQISTHWQTDVSLTHDGPVAVATVIFLSSTQEN